MAKDKPSGAQSKREQLEGTRPAADEDRRREKEKPEATAGEAPMDPADEEFIEETRKD